MHNLGNKKALQRILGGIKGLWIANTEQYRIRVWEKQVYDASDVAESYGLLTKYIASLEH